MSASMYGLREADCAVDIVDEDAMFDKDEVEAGLNECCSRESNERFIGGAKASARQSGLVNVEVDVVANAKKREENRNLIGRLMKNWIMNDPSNGQSVYSESTYYGNKIITIVKGRATTNQR
jgi:hypothetical protein